MKYFSLTQIASRFARPFELPEFYLYCIRTYTSAGNLKLVHLAHRSSEGGYFAAFIPLSICCVILLGIRLHPRSALSTQQVQFLN